MDNKSNELEENNQLEYCKVCSSLYILDTTKGVVCKSCGTENYTDVCDEEEYFNKRLER